jgi:hypothetical protein
MIAAGLSQSMKVLQSPAISPDFQSFTDSARSMVSVVQWNDRAAANCALAN